MVKRLNAKERKIEKEVLWILIFMAAVIVVFLVVSLIFRSLSEFNYKGLHFSKERFGKLVVYHYYYYFNDNQGKITQYNLYLRNDPRNSSIPVTGTSVLFDKPLYLTVKTANLTECSDSILAIGDLARFLGENGLKVNSGNMDYLEAATAHQEYVTCENKNESDVIQIVSGNETRIDIMGDCATITIGPSCDILQAVEIFKIQSIIDKKNDDIGLY
jgi:hypothetical protein